MIVSPGINDTTVASILRAPKHVMRLFRIGSFHQTRISFARTLIRRMAQEGWQITAHEKRLDRNGIGRIIYRIDTPRGPLTFSGFSNPLAPSERTDRVIAEKWDAAFTLSLGPPETVEIDALEMEVPLQEMGRFGPNEIVLSRANKSVRLFEGVINSLASGNQPDVHEISKVGYLMRTTAVYGNGKFGLADFEKLGLERDFTLPFQAEMLSVYMTRQFTIDLIDHCAGMRGGKRAVTLARPIRRMLGIGNATGLGMAPYLINHPKLLNNWIAARETALARVRLIERPTGQEVIKMCALIDRCRIHITEWPTTDHQQNLDISRMGEDLELVSSLLADKAWFNEPRPWDRLIRWAELNLHLETQELLVSIIMEPYGALIDDLETTNSSDEREETWPEMLLGDLKKLIETNYDWALALDCTKPNGDKYFWYRSAEKEEPRLGERYMEPGAELEMPIGIARDVTRLYEKLGKLDDEINTGEFLIAWPEFRRVVRRIQTLAELPYAEIRDNLIGSGCEPVNILRCKLSIFGATKFDPKSKLWTRITLFQGAPLPDELTLPAADDWFAPIFPRETAV